MSEAVSPPAPRRSDSDEALTLEAPSHFWRELGAEHARDLTTFGIEHVKRHQALRYFIWRWRFSTLRASEQFRFMLRHSSPGHAGHLRSSAGGPLLHHVLGLDSLPMARARQRGTYRFWR